MRLIFPLLLLIFLAGCTEDRRPKYAVSQAKRQEVFERCLSKIPAGPVSVKYNDWDEVIKACDKIAKSQAMFCIANCDSSLDWEGRLDP